MNKIYNSGQHLLGIINDILDFSKIESGKITIEYTDFSMENVLENLSDLIGEKCSQKGLELIFEIDPEIPEYLCGDSLRIGQILINYTNNAVKFTEEGEIIIRIKKLSQKNNECILKFEVEDTGIGLTKDQKSILFRSFQQADTSTTRKYGGTGLGLAISKNLAELMGGNVGLESEYGKGSTFWFTAKFLISSNEKLSEIKNILPSHLSVLVVDDNCHARTVLSDMLRSIGLETDEASSGKDALEIIKKEQKHYEIIYMDMQMPVMDGTEATKEIRKNHNFDGLPIIAMTANAMESDREKCLNAGMNDHIAKPINPENLLNVLKKWIPVESEKILPKKSNMSFMKIKGLDTEKSLKRLMGKEKIYKELLIKYKDSNKNFYNEITESIKNNDYETAQRIAHTLKGVSGAVGAEEVEKLSGILEKSIKLKNKNINTLISQTSLILKEIISNIENAFPENVPGKTKSEKISEMSELKNILSKLKPAVETAKPKRCSEILTEYEKFVWPENLKTEAENLYKTIKKYKFRDALKIIELLETTIGVE